MYHVGSMETEGGSQLAERINKLLAARNESPAKLARDSGLSPGAISKVLSGKSQNVRGDTISRIAAALEVSADFLQGVSDDPAQGSGAPLPEYALEILESMRKLDSAQNYELLIIARSLVHERDVIRGLSVVAMVQAAAEYYGDGAELERFERELQSLEESWRRGRLGISRRTGDSQ